MTAAAEPLPRARQRAVQPWLRSPGWDLTFVILSVLLAFVPYSVFLVFGASGSFETKGTAAYEMRVLINTLVSILIGGPHMYATFTRTIMDPVFLRRRLPLIASTIAIPIAVFVLGVTSYETYVWLLTVFFALAALHALYQVIWLSDAYSARAHFLRPWQSRLIDYGVVLTSLFPFATLKMVEGAFKIGPVSLKYHDLITSILPALPGNNRLWSGQHWLSSLVFLAFFMMLALWLSKTIVEYRNGMLNVPKTLLIAVTVTLMFFTPALPNMDTAFQGVNTWHSFQYLVLTWYAGRLLERKTGRRVGFLHWADPAAPSGDDRAARSGAGAAGFWSRLKGGARALLRPLDRQSGWTTFYLVCLAMLPISGALMWGSQAVWPDLGSRGPGADEVYSYMGILSILLVHYVQDAILFTDAQAIVP